MKIVLINPPNFRQLQSESPTFVGKNRGYNPPMGLIWMATCINKQSAHTAKVLDCQVLEYTYKEIEAYIKSEKPDVVGIAAITFLLLDAYESANLIKKIDPSIKIIIGGPHATLFPDETISHPSVDFVIKGEGEISFPALLDSLEKGSQFSSVPGLIYKENGHPKRGPPPKMIEDLNELPIPDRTLTPYKQYSSVLAHANPLTTAVTSRGCPYRCTFCDRPQMGGKTWRARSAKLVVDEMEDCQRLGIKEIMFYDDTFTMIRDRAMAICKEVIDRGLDIRWDCRTRVDRVDAELVRMMKKAGCSRINFGVESGTQKGLDTVKKGVTLEKVREAFRICREENMETLGYFMIGLPGETKQEMYETIKFAKSVRPNFLHFTVLLPFPDTQIWRDLIAKGDMRAYNSWKEFAKNPSENFMPPTANEVVSKDELFKICNEGYRSFYLRPRYVASELARVRSFGELLRKSAAGLRLLTST